MDVFIRCTYLLWTVGLVLNIVSLHHVCLTSVEWQGDLSVYELASFMNPDILRSTENRQSILNHFALNDDDVYVGGVNWLYRLDSQLKQIKNIITCGKADSTQCRLNSNHNKILVVDTLEQNRLITCGSEFSGICQFRNLTNIAQVIDTPEYNVAGYGKATTVSLIAPKQGTDYLYVAVSYVDKDVYRQIPPLSRRSLQDLSVFYEDSLIFQTNRPIHIQYVIAFSYPQPASEFTYFVTSQPEDSGSTVYVSKISRVCQVVYATLDSYTEITIQCSGSDGSVYSLVQAAHLGPAGHDLAASLGLNASEMVLYAVFAKGSNGEPMEQSALCVYKMSDVLDAFKEAVRGCIQEGTDNSDHNDDSDPDAYRVRYLVGSLCSNFLSVSPDNYLCNPVADGSTQLYKYAKGITPLPSTAILEVPDILMSSIITSTEVNHTVAFIGSSSGQLLKVHIEGSTSARVYERVPLDTSPVLRDVKIDDTTRVMHVLTEQKLIKMRVENCSQYTTCETCIGMGAGMDGDPYCGWCTLERMCTRYSECPSPDVSTRWLVYNAAQCIEITTVAPDDSLPITVTEKITHTVKQLPDLAVNQRYECHFGEYVSPATKTGDVLECTSPPSDRIPPIQQGDDAVTVDLSVYSSETSVEFIDTKFHFYECSTHTSCVSCVGSRWACDWCVFENRCTHDTSICTGQDEIIVTGERNQGSSMQGPDACPQLLPQTDQVYVSNAINRIIAVNAVNLPDTSLISGYQCRLNIEGEYQSVDAARVGSTFSCDPKSYTYSANEQELNVTLTLQWTDTSNKIHLMDDRYGFTVTMYKCEVLRPDCSRCVSEKTTGEELACVWCGDTCVVSETCSGDMVTPTNSRNCPDPVILEVYPPGGPDEGNTILTLTALDLGRRFSDIQEVTVGGQMCNLDGLGRYYRTGISVSCTTIPSDDLTPQLLRATITGATGEAQQSQGVVTFQYKNPVITDFKPKIGPQSGGTQLTISGENLNAGRTLQASIGGIPCMLEMSEISVNSIKCTTTNARQLGSWNIHLHFDGALRISEMKYSYARDPTVKGFEPSTSVLGGGRDLKVDGTGFSIIQQPQTLVTVGDSRMEFTGNCRVESDTEMVCTSPKIDLFNLVLSNDFNINFSTGFIMDGVTSLRTCLSQDTCTPLKYFHNPVYHPFNYDIYKYEDDIAMKDGEVLYVRGERLDLAITRKEITVYIGTELCTVISIGSNVLLCTLPQSQPQPGDYMGRNTSRNLPFVVVFHGANLRFNIGFIRYPSTSNTVLIVCVVSGVVLLIFIVLAIVLYRKFVVARRELRKRRTDLINMKIEKS